MNNGKNIGDESNFNSPLGVRGNIGNKTNLIPLQGLGVNFKLLWK